MTRSLLIYLVISSVYILLATADTDPATPTIKKAQKPMREITELSPNTLFLAPPEIKLFAGYTFNFLRSKCPQVNSTRIFELQKFVSKRSLGKIHEISDKKTAFHQLLKSLRECTSRLSQRSMFRFGDWGNVLENLLKDIMKEARAVIENTRVIDKIELIYEAVLEQFDKLKGLLFGTEDKIPDEVVKKYASSSKEESGRKRRHVSGNGDIDGEQVFRGFLKDVLHLFVHTCRPYHKLTLFFKAASEDLFNYLTVDKIIADKAAAYYLPSDFLKNVTSCAAADR